MSLSDLTCRRAAPREKPYKLPDGGGLYLLVQPNGSKLWRLNYRFGGKHKTLAFGIYPVVGLLDARQKALDAKRILAAKRDPGAKGDSAGKRTFRQDAEHWLETNSRKWSADQRARIEKRLHADVYPDLGDRPTDEISARDVLNVIRKVEKRGVLDTARRINQNINGIFALASIEGHVQANPAASVVKALQAPAKTSHRAKLTASGLPDFFRRLSTYEGAKTTALGLEVTLHTMVRTIELRFATWKEIEGDTWRIPAERMKMKREHLVPLTPEVLGLLDQLRDLGQGSAYVLPGIRGKPVSENTLLYALYRMGYHGRATVHGFRGTASTILNEHGFNRDWIEMQLAHSDDDAVRSAYNAAEYLAQRRDMLRWWSDYLMKQKESGSRDLLDELL